MFASLVGRIPISVTALAILLFVQARSGSFASAGAISAAYVLGLACASPLVGRLVDRRGPRGILMTTALIYPAALLLLIPLVGSNAHPAWIAAAAALAGAALPPVTVCLRALFPQLLADDQLLQTAYALDSALVEMIFIAGPILVAGFIVLAYPQGALYLAATCGAIGSIIFLRSAAVRHWTLHEIEPDRSLLGPLRDRQLLALFAATLLYAGAFGLFEVGVSALAANQNRPAAAGLILGAASIGSTVGALIYGSRTWQPAVTAQFLAALVLMALGIAAVAPITDLYWFAAIAIFACAPMSVALAAESTLISRLAQPTMLTESFTWMGTFLLTGVSSGIAAGGLLVDRFPPLYVFIAAAAATGFAALLAWLNLDPVPSAAARFSGAEKSDDSAQF
ncbi:MAG: MFS transporter [Pseudomonadota bacterium]|nr:MFS transporter [Burkholderiales bacterium]MDQ3197194.1 MFS transporter [Pseudomonadota bacterium]